MLAGYQSASDVEQHSKIDLDMEELETKVGEYATNANWVAEAMFIYENGGGGLCQQTDVDAARAGTARLKGTARVGPSPRRPRK